MCARESGGSSPISGIGLSFKSRCINPAVPTVRSLWRLIEDPPHSKRQDRASRSLPTSSSIIR